MAGDFRSNGAYAIVEVQQSTGKVVSRKVICSKWLIDLQGKMYCYVHPGDEAKQLEVAEKFKDARHPTWTLQPVSRIVEYAATHEEARQAFDKRSRNQRRKQKGYSDAYTSGGDLTEGGASNGEDDAGYIDKVGDMAPPQLPAFPTDAVSPSNANAAAQQASATTNGKQKNQKRKSIVDSYQLESEPALTAAKRLRFSSSSSNSSRDEDGSSTANSPDISTSNRATGAPYPESTQDVSPMEQMPLAARASTSSHRLADPPISQSTPLSRTAPSLRQTTWTSVPSGVAAQFVSRTPQLNSLERANAVTQLSRALKVLADVDPEEMTDSAKLTWLMARQMETDRTINSMRVEQEQLSRRVSTNCCSGRRGGIAIGADQDDFEGQFPFDDIKKLRDFDKSLKNHKTSRDKFRTFLTTKMDSKDYKASVNNVLAEDITNKLGSTKLTAKGRKENIANPEKQKYGVRPMEFWRIARQFIMAKHVLQERDLIDAQLDVWMRGRAEAVRRGKH